MIHLTRKSARAIAATLAVLLGLLPIAGDVHFATTRHRWCPLHERLEDVRGVTRAPLVAQERGVSRRRRVHGNDGYACLVEMAASQAAHPAFMASAPHQLSVLASILPSAERHARSTFLDDAPTRGPPAA